MASIHIPLFLDGKFTTSFRGSPHIDGSFFANMGDYCITNDDKRNNSVILDWSADPYLSNRNLADSVSALSEDGIWDLVEKGRQFAVQMEKRGDFEFLHI